MLMPIYLEDCMGGDVMLKVVKQPLQNFELRACVPYAENSCEIPICMYRKDMCV